jgi:hypothetical protein
MTRFAIVGVLACIGLFAVGLAGASTPGIDMKLTHDASDPGYVSAYTIGTGTPWTDRTLTECSRSRGRENEPAVAIDPRDTSVIVGSSNDYCGVYNQNDANGNPIATGPIWLGYYRSENGGASFTSSLVPGYPDDTSPYAALAKVRTATAGDPVLAWDAQGRLFAGAESSGDPAGSPKTFGDVFVARFVPAASGLHPDGKAFAGSVTVAKGSSAPNLLGVFNDKTTLEADRNGDTTCDNNVYFAYSRFSGNGNNGIYFSRSTDHGASFSQPMKISDGVHGSQFPDIAVTGSSHVYVTWREFESKSGQPDAIVLTRSTDCGQTFTKPQIIQTFTPYDAQDVRDPQPIPTPTSSLDDPLSSDSAEPAAGRARDCGDFSAHCQSGYTFFRRDTQVRMTADQFDTANTERLYFAYDPTKLGTEVATGTTYGSINSGTGSQSGIYFLRVNGATGALEAGPNLIDPETVGHQLFPDISADNPNAATRGTLHAIWWDSRLDPCYSAARPIGNCAVGTTRTTTASLDTWGAVSTNYGSSWSSSRVSNVTTNPNYEQFSNRAVPFAGDYLYVSSVGDLSFGVWTDWRDTVTGTDPREVTEDEDGTTADVLQCRVFSGGAWSGDRCPRNGGIDQNIYGDLSP